MGDDFYLKPKKDRHGKKYFANSDQFCKIISLEKNPLNPPSSPRNSSLAFHKYVWVFQFTVTRTFKLEGLKQ